MIAFPSSLQEELEVELTTNGQDLIDHAAIIEPP